ncbi:MAG: serine acetyltransferase [Thiobacillus sp.]
MEAIPNQANPFASKLLIGSAKRRKLIPHIHRLICTLLGSDVYCAIPRGLLLPHPYGVIIHRNVILGENVIIMQQVTIGQKSPVAIGVPVIGDNVYIGAGAKLLGSINIGNNVTVGANAVVTRDVPEGATVVGSNRILNASCN